MLLIARLCKAGCTRQHHTHDETDIEKALTSESIGANRRWFPSAMGHDSQPADESTAKAWVRNPAGPI